MEAQPVRCSHRGALLVPPGHAGLLALLFQCVRGSQMPSVGRSSCGKGAPRYFGHARNITDVAEDLCAAPPGGTWYVAFSLT